MRLSTALLLLAPLSLLGCGAAPGNSVGSSSSNVESSSTNGSSAAFTPTSFPSFAPLMAQVQNHGGMVARTPTVVTITWNGDANQNAYENFADSIGATSYWAALSEYGIGPLQSSAASHVEETHPLPSTVDIADLDAYVAAHVTNGWPTFSTENVYLLFIPANIFVTAKELGVHNACDAVDGYHTEVNAGPSGHVPYAAIIGQCHSVDGQANLNAETTIASHELVETTSDPHTRSDLGYIGFGSHGLGWELFQSFQDELADACEFYADDAVTISAETHYSVQRFWSNNAAAHGHDPCLPASSAPYYNATPLKLDTIAVEVTKGAEATTTQGIRVAPGTTVTVPIGYYSDAPLGAWSLTAVEGDGSSLVSNPRLSLSIDSPMGADGDTANLIITARHSYDEDDGNAVLVTLVSWSVTSQPHFMPLLVGVY